MKLIIDIPDNEYKQNKHYYDSVYHGTPLDTAENKGAWLLKCEFPIRWECSHCHTSSYERLNYCPNCGADMRTESKDPNDMTHMFDGVTEFPKDAFKGWDTEELLEQIRAESEDKQ